MSNRFFFGDDDDSESGEDNLPYPKPLARSAFLTPDFDPTTYLSSLRNRHQTLDDLRAELRTRSQDISKELLDLVNGNYQDFLSLGSNLRGGDEKVEEVRLGLLGFKRELEGLKSKVDERKKEVEGLVAQRKVIRKQMQLGRALLDLDYRLDEKVMDDDHTNSESDENSEEGEEGNGSIARLNRHVRQYLLAKKIMDRVGPRHPSAVEQEVRIERVRDTILLDLGNALKQSDGHESAQTIRLLAAYRDLGESQEATKILREHKV